LLGGGVENRVSSFESPAAYTANCLSSLKIITVFGIYDAHLHIH